MNPDLSAMPMCGEDWEAMERLPDGRRLCTRCHHPVADFRGMTKAEITMLHVMSDERVCGVYSPEQLAPVATPEPRRGRSPLVALALGASLLAARAEAQTVDRPATEQAQLPADGHASPQPTKQPPAPSTADAQDTFVIRGTVRDAKTHQPIRGAAVMIEGTWIRGVSDSAGGFALRVNEPARQFTLRAGGLGYATRKVQLTAGAPDAVIELDARAVEMTMGIVATTTRTPRPDWQKAGFSIGRIDLSDQ